jgi:hypothetical protein
MNPSPTPPGWSPLEGHEREAVAARIINVRTVTIATYRYLRYRPSGAQQMKKPGRWQVATEHGWANCEPPAGAEWQPCPDMAKVTEGSGS